MIFSQSLLVFQFHSFSFGKSSSVIGDYLGVILDNLGIIWDHLGITRDHLGVIWDHLGIICDHLGDTWCHLEVILVDSDSQSKFLSESVSQSVSHIARSIAPPL